MQKQSAQDTTLLIGHAPVYSLAEILEFKAIPMLKKLADIHGLKGVSNLNKPELIRSIVEALPVEKEIADNLTMVSDEEWTLLQTAAKHRELIEEDQSATRPVFLISVGYLAAFEHNNKLFYVVPDEIKNSLSNLMQSGYGDERAYITSLNKYALAATSLYGVITLADFVELFKSQNERKTNIDDVSSILLRYVATDEGYCFWKEYLVNDGFEENDFKDVERIAKTASSKPRYQPAKEEFLRYADDIYYEITPQMMALKDFIENKLRVKESEDLYLILLEIHRLCSNEADIKPILEVFSSRGISISNAGMKRELTQLVTEVMNCTRLWMNNGHTPNELLDEVKRPNMRQISVQPGQPYRNKKIGRNEPCPCGSGKKYKKCCLG